VAILGEHGTLAVEALAWMLEQSGSRVLGIYPSARALKADLDGTGATPRVVFLDAEDSVGGVAAVPEVRRVFSALKIVLLCEALTPPVLRCALEHGVEGVVLKSDSVEELVAALRHVLEGRAVMPGGWQDVAVEAAEASPVESLSAREREVLELAAGGMRNKEIAARLMISPNTVKFHLRTIYSRLGVRNRVQAARAVAAPAARQETSPVESNSPDEDDRRR